MEQQQGDPRPPFPPENYGKRMWQLWGPILIKWGIEFLVSIVAMTFLAMAYQFADPEAFLEALDSEEAMIRLYDQLITRFLEAGTLIQGSNVSGDHSRHVDLFPQGSGERKNVWSDSEQKSSGLEIRSGGSDVSGLMPGVE